MPNTSARAGRRRSGHDRSSDENTIVRLNYAEASADAGGPFTPNFADAAAPFPPTFADVRAEAPGLFKPDFAEARADVTDHFRPDFAEAPTEAAGHLRPDFADVSGLLPPRFRGNTDGRNGDHTRLQKRAGTSTCTATTAPPLYRFNGLFTPKPGFTITWVYRVKALRATRLTNKKAREIVPALFTKECTSSTALEETLPPERIVFFEVRFVVDQQPRAS